MKPKELSREELAASMGIDLSHLTEEEIEVFFIEVFSRLFRKVVNVWPNRSSCQLQWEQARLTLRKKRSSGTPHHGQCLARKYFRVQIFEPQNSGERKSEPVLVVQKFDPKKWGCPQSIITKSKSALSMRVPLHAEFECTKYPNSAW